MLVAFTVHVTALAPLKDAPARYPAPVIDVDTWVAVPLSVADIIPAMKLPELSLATMEFPVNALVAFTVQVTAEAPLNNVPLRYPAPMIEFDT